MANTKMKKSMRARPLVGILMGSDSDLPAMKGAAAVLDQFEISYELNVLSAHRTPEETAQYARTAVKRGLKVIIAGAGGAAHLPGVVASFTPLPVIGVPMDTVLNGLDSLLSIVQMPPGIPVATVGVGAGRNAGLLAIRVLAVSDPELRKHYLVFMKQLASESQAKNRKAQAAMREAQREE